MKFRMFCAQHSQMAETAQAIIDTLMASVSERDATGHDALPALRLELSRCVANHCSAEIALLRDHLKQHPDIAVTHSPLVRRYHDELLAWRGALMECNANWPAKRIAKDPAAFLAVFRPLVDALHERVRWEEQVFYPQVLGRKVEGRLAA
jgi:hypothetical protein